MAIAEAASAVAKILHWIVGEKNPNDDLTSVGGRASALQVLLDPRARYRSLAAFARDAKPARLPKRNSPNSEAKCHADGWLNCVQALPRNNRLNHLERALTLETKKELSAPP